MTYLKNIQRFNVVVNTFSLLLHSGNKSTRREGTRERKQLALENGANYSCFYDRARAKKILDVTKRRLDVAKRRLRPFDKMIVPKWACHYGPLTSSFGRSGKAAGRLTDIKNWRKKLRQNCSKMSGKLAWRLTR